MALLLLILRSLIPLFALIGLGYSLRRWSILHHEHVPVLNGLVVNVLLPASILCALMRAPALSPRMMLLPLLLIIVEFILLAVVFGLGRGAGFSPSILGAAMLGAVFGNTVFLGYPVVQALLPSQFPSAVMIDEFGMMVILYPAAALLGGWFSGASGQEGTAAAIRRFLRGPLFLALMFGITLRLLPFPAALAGHPAVKATTGMIMQCLTYLAQATTAVVLLALGVALEPRAGGGPSLALWSACAIKLLLAPALMWGLCLLVGVTGEPRTVAVLQAAMPTAVLTAILARQHGLDHRFSVRVVCLTTALSTLTIPLIMALLRL